jgi:hypothetical protein
LRHLYVLRAAAAAAAAAALFIAVMCGHVANCTRSLGRLYVSIVAADDAAALLIAVMWWA